VGGWSVKLFKLMDVPDDDLRIAIIKCLEVVPLDNLHVRSFMKTTIC
jgi:hypothetical protein